MVSILLHNEKMRLAIDGFSPAYAQTDLTLVVPWDDIEQSPKDFIISSFLPVSLSVKEPSHYEPDKLFLIQCLTMIHQEKNMLEPFVLFMDASKSCGSKTGLKSIDVVDLTKSGDSDSDLEVNLCGV